MTIRSGIERGFIGIEICPRLQPPGWRVRLRLGGVWRVRNTTLLFSSLRLCHKPRRAGGYTSRESNLACIGTCPVENLLDPRLERRPAYHFKVFTRPRRNYFSSDHHRGRLVLPEPPAWYDRNPPFRAPHVEGRLTPSLQVCLIFFSELPLFCLLQKASTYLVDSLPRTLAILLKNMSYPIVSPPQPRSPPRSKVK